MKTKNVLSILALLLVISFFSCKKNDKTGSELTMTTTDPLNNVTGVARNKNITFTFSEAMDPLTINSSTFLS